MLNPFMEIEKKDRTKTEDYVALIDDYNNLANNVEIVYQLVEEPIEGLIALLEDQTEPKNHIVENAVNNFMTNQMADSINNAINNTLSPKVQTEVELVLGSYKEELKNDFEAEFNLFKSDIQTQMDALELSLISQMNNVLSSLTDLQDNINTLVQNSISASLDTTIQATIDRMLGDELVKYIRSIPKGAPTGSNLIEGSIWYEIDE